MHMPKATFLFEDLQAEVSCMCCSMSGDFYSSMLVPSEPVAPSLSMAEVLQQCKLESGWDVDVTGGGILKPDQASKVISGLSQEVDRSASASDMLDRKIVSR